MAGLPAGIVVGDSRTGEIDKVDGPYYFFKLLQQARRVLPSWMPAVGIEGGEINIVPVDFVADAIDHIAHQAGSRRPDLPPHRSGAEERRRGDQPLRPRRRRAAGGAAARFRRDRSGDLAVRTGLRFFPPARRAVKAGLGQLGIPAGMLSYVNYPTRFDSSNAQAALKGSGIAVPPLESYADASGTTGSATSIPISSSTAP